MGAVRDLEALIAQLKLPAESRAAWVEEHGFERALDLPWAESFPEMTEDRLLSERPAAKLLGGVRVEPTLPEPHPVQRAWTQRDRAILELHFRYFTEVFDFNNWKMCNRYKRHLPAARRQEVEDLLTRIWRRSPEAELRAALEAILDGVWEADDWAAAIQTLIRRGRLSRCAFRETVDEPGRTHPRQLTCGQHSCPQPLRQDRGIAG